MRPRQLQIDEAEQRMEEDRGGESSPGRAPRLLLLLPRQDLSVYGPYLALQDGLLWTPERRRSEHFHNYERVAFSSRDTSGANASREGHRKRARETAEDIS